MPYFLLLTSAFYMSNILAIPLWDIFNYGIKQDIKNEDHIFKDYK